MNKITEQDFFDSFEFLHQGNSPSDYMFFGLEIGKGWFPLFWELCSELKKVNYRGRIVQVKEKFGRLTVYTNDYEENIDEIISKYENKSLTICERCGKEGKVRNNGWIKVLCDECEGK